MAQACTDVEQVGPIAPVKPQNRNILRCRRALEATAAMDQLVVVLAHTSTPI